MNETVAGASMTSGSGTWDSLLWTLPVVALLVLFVVQMVRHRAKVLAWLLSAESALAGPEPLGTDDRANPFVQAVSAVQAPGFEWGTKSASILKGAIPTTAPIREVLHETADAEIDRAATFHLGGLLTGVGLALTFLVIFVLLRGLASTINVGESEDLSAVIKNLKLSIGDIGAKFILSAATVGAGVIHGAVAAGLRWDVSRNVDRVAAGLASRYVTLHHVETALRLQALDRAAEQLEKLQELRSGQDRGFERLAQVSEEGFESLVDSSEAESANTDRLLTELNTSVNQQAHEVVAQMMNLAEATRSLSSIQVSVADIGTEVKTNLRRMLKEEVGEEIKALMAEQKVNLEVMAEAMSERVGQKVEAALVEVVRGLNEGMGAIRASLEKRSESSMSDVLDRLGGLAGDHVRVQAESLDGVVSALKDTIGGLRESFASFEEKMATIATIQSHDQNQFRTQLLDASSRAAHDLRGATQQEIAKLTAALDAVTVSVGQLADQLFKQANARESVFVNSMTALQVDVENNASRTMARFQEQIGQMLADAKAGMSTAQAAAAGDMQRVAKTLEALGTTMLGSYQAHEQQMQQAVKTRTAESTELVKRFETEARSALESTLNGLGQELSTLLSRVDSSLLSSARRLDEMQVAVAKATMGLVRASELLEKTSSSTQDVSSQLKPAVEELSRAFLRAQQTHSAADAVARSLGESARLLKENVERTGRVTETAAQVTKEQAILGQAIQDVYPRLLDKFTQNAASVVGQTTQAAGKVVSEARIANEQIANQLLSAVQGMSDAVSELVSVHEQRTGVRPDVPTRGRG